MKGWNGSSTDWLSNDVVCLAVPVHKYNNTPHFFLADGTSLSYINSLSAQVWSLFRWNPPGAPGPNDQLVRLRRGRFVEYLSLWFSIRIRRNFAATTQYVESVRFSILLQDVAAISSGGGATYWTSLFKTSIQGAVASCQGLLAPMAPTSEFGRFTMLRDVFLYSPPLAPSGANTGWTCTTAGGDDYVCTDTIDLRGIFAQLHTYSDGYAYPITNKIAAVIACQGDNVSSNALVADFQCRLHWRETE